MNDKVRAVTEDDTGLKVLFEPTDGKSGTSSAEIECDHCPRMFKLSLKQNIASSRFMASALTQTTHGVRMSVQKKLGDAMSTGSRTETCSHRWFQRREYCDMDTCPSGSGTMLFVKKLARWQTVSSGL
jgi:hypothetical protein